jgi:hypothetical protein
MMLDVYLGMLRRAEEVLADSFRTVGDGHADEPDVYGICRLLAEQCDAHEQALRPVIARYGERPDDEPERLHAAALESVRTGPLGLLRDLQDLHLLAQMVDGTYTLIQQAAAALRDEELLGIIRACQAETGTQIAWVGTRMKQAAPQALVVAG